MSLTVGTGPFTKHPAGRFNVDIDAPNGVLYFDPVPHRIRAFVAGKPVVDSRRVHLLHETEQLPVYYFPDEDFSEKLLEPSEKRTHCPRKGDASYRSIRVGDRVVPDAV